jgi:hypothetical protein
MIATDFAKLAEKKSRSETDASVRDEWNAALAKTR